MAFGQLICAVLGVWLLATVLRSLYRGKLTLRNGLDIHRRQDGAAFWSTVALTLCLVAACLAIAWPPRLH